jgi:hypothetical protein
LPPKQCSLAGGNQFIAITLRIKQAVTHILCITAGFCRESGSGNVKNLAKRISAAKRLHPHQPRSTFAVRTQSIFRIFRKNSLNSSEHHIFASNWKLFGRRTKSPGLQIVLKFLDARAPATLPATVVNIIFQPL